MRGGIEISLTVFQGPMELLLHLISKNEIDIYDIPVAEITRQYMEYIVDYTGDMDSISSFIVMASTLLEIKSRMLLPAEPGLEQPPEDPRAGLVERLIEYKRYMSVLDDWRRNEQKAAPLVCREPEKTVLSLVKRQKPSVEKLLGGVTAQNLFTLFKDALDRQSARAHPPPADSIKKETFTVEGKIAYILDLLLVSGVVDFMSLFGEFVTKNEIIVTFIAILELARAKRADVAQEEPFGAIIIFNARAA